MSVRIALLPATMQKLFAAGNEYRIGSTPALEGMAPVKPQGRGYSPFSPFCRLAIVIREMHD